MNNHTHKTRRLLVACVTAVSLLAAACGSDDPAPAASTGDSAALTAAQEELAQAQADLAAAEGDSDALAKAEADLAAAEAALADAGEGSDAMADLGQVNFALEWVASGYHAPFYLAQAEDLWGKRGLRVNIREGSGSGNAVDAVAGGANDIAIADRTTIAIKASAGAEVLSVFGLVNKGALTVSCTPDSGVAAPADLPGKTILTTLAGSDGSLLPAFLAVNDLAEGDVTVEGTDPVGKTTLLLAGTGDCSTFVSYVQPVQIGYGTDGTDGTELVDLLWADYGLNVLGNGLVVNADWAAANPEALSAFIAGIQEAYEMTIADSDAAIAAWSLTFPRENGELANNQLVASLDSVFSDNTEGEQVGFQSIEDWTVTIDQLADAGSIETPLDPAEYFSNDYLPAG